MCHIPYILQYLNLFIHSWAFGLFPHLGYYTKCFPCSCDFLYKWQQFTFHQQGSRVPISCSFKSFLTRTILQSVMWFLVFIGMSLIIVTLALFNIYLYDSFGEISILVICSLLLFGCLHFSCGVLRVLYIFCISNSCVMFEEQMSCLGV